MRELNIACANSRSTKQLTNKKIELSALKERLKVTIRTTESAEEYARLPRSKRDAAKDHGGIVAGVLKDGRRKIDTVVSRSMVTLDGDRIEAEFLEDYERRVPYTSILYSTHSHTPETPRVRILVPLTRDVTPEEYVAVARYLAQSLGMDYLTNAPTCPTSSCTGPAHRPTGSLYIRRRTGRGLTRTKSCRRIRNGQTLPGCLPPPGRAGRRGSGIRNRQIRWKRKVLLEFSITPTFL